MKLQILSVALGLALLAAVGFNFYHLNSLTGKLAVSNAELVSSTAKLRNLEQELTLMKGDNVSLTESLQSEKERNDNFAGQIDDIADTVGVLEKIKNTDPELLRKYSKVYFLNENYIPAKLSSIPDEYLFNKNKPQLFQADVLPHLEDMFSSAAKDGIDLRVSSAFRSFENQAAVKSSHLLVYGSGANQFSADQGYSEHQLGTTVDLILPTLTFLTTDFEKTKAYEWLTANAYRYGFILSYPKGNTYYQFEPWHWRFVGLHLARYLHKEDKYFYDLDQRLIDEYRADFFN
jgi:LAS superfamily LD-carboxypeptidase LdcB